MLDSAALRAIAGDPQAFLQQIDLAGRRALFVRADESELRAASFLDERLGLQKREGVWVPFEQFLAPDFLPESHRGPADFIFHIGHCGSTLLSRLLDRSPDVLGLREPLVLRELAAEQRNLDTPLARSHPQQWQTLLCNSLQLWERGFSPGQRIVVKATSTCNNLIEPILQARPQSRAVLLYLRLEPYLATMIKRPGGGIDAQHAAPARLEFLHGLLGDSSIRLPDLHPSEILAMGWTAELARFSLLMSNSNGTDSSPKSAISNSLLPLREKVAQSAGRGERSEAAAPGTDHPSPQPSPARGEGASITPDQFESVPFTSDPLCSERLLMLDFEQLLADVPAMLDSVRRHLRLPAPRDGAGQDEHNPVMKSYAKDPAHAYSPGDRLHDLALSRRTFADEISQGMRWADRLIQAKPSLGHLRPLLG